MKRIWSILMLGALLALPALACGGSATPEAPPTLSASPTPASTPTPSAKDHVEQGIAYSDAGDVDAAITEYEAALDLDPENVEAHVNLGMIFIDEARYAEAATHFEAALAVESDNDAASGGLCVAYAFNQPDRAEAQCQAALERQPNNADVYNGLGIAIAMQRRYDEAVVAFKEAIRLQPEHPWAHNNLGFTYLKQDRLDEAIEELNVALRINPENAQAHYNLGLAFAKQGKYDQAIPSYQEALRFEPDMAAAYYDLGLIYRNLGQREQAIAALEKFLELAPDASDRANIEAMIAEMREPVALSPGTYIEFDDALDYDSDDDADFFSFFNSPASFFGDGEDTVTVTVQPQEGLDVSITVLDTSTSNKIVLSDVNEAGPGGEEHLTLTLPDPGSAMGVFMISIIAVDGSGDYHAFFSGSPAVGFFLSNGWEVNGVLGDQSALFVVVSALGGSGKVISIEATPRQEDNLDLFITAVDTSSNKNMGTLNDGGVGEPEGDSFTAGNSVYLFIVGDQKGHPGRVVINYHQ